MQGSRVGWGENELRWGRQHNNAVIISGLLVELEVRMLAVDG